SPCRTFAPLWEVFRISSDKLALCHLELMKKLHDLIKEISRYGEEQGRVHKKVPRVSPPACAPSPAPQSPLPTLLCPQSKEEVSGTLEAVQLLHGVAQLLPKSKESYHSKCQEYERLRKEGTSQKEIDKVRPPPTPPLLQVSLSPSQRLPDPLPGGPCALLVAPRFQEVEEAHLRHMKGLIGSYSHSVEDTHVQIGQVHEEFKQNVENIGTEMLLRRFAESKGTGRERPVGGLFLTLSPSFPGPKRSRSKAFRIPGLSRKERERDAVRSLAGCVPQGCPEVDEDGFTVRPDIARTEAENPGCSSSDSDYDEDEPRKFYVHIKPVQPREGPGSAEASVEQLKATVGNLILPPGIGVSLGLGGLWDPWDHWGRLTPVPFSCRALSGDRRHVSSVPPAALFGPPLESAFEAEDFPAPRAYVLTSSSSPFSSSSPENVEDSGLDSPSHPAPGPSPDSRPWTPQPGTPQSPLPKQGGLPDPPVPPSTRDPGAWAPRPRSPSGRLPEPPNFAVFSGPGAEGLWGDGGAAPRGRSRCLSGPAPREAPSPDPFGEPLPWVRPRSPGGDQPPLTCPSSNSASSSSSSPAPLSGGESSSPSPWTCQGSGTRLSEGGTSGAPASQSEPARAPSDPSQSDPSTKDFWLNMAALTGHLQRQAEQSPAASYYNVALLKYQFSRLGPGSAPLRLCVRWDCAPGATRVTVDYGYNAGALALPVPLANVHVLLPVEEPLTNLRLQPTASWYLGDQNHPTPTPVLSPPGCGRLSASWEPLGGPSKPSPVAAQFSSEGSTLSGVEVELASAGYRMSLVKKRFATGTAGEGS
ncbi:FCHO1 protein, partial [Onychorhynchus coronatus]|nr:FCHO1 protein [Onychorhynchus coronatus]